MGILLGFELLMVIGLASIYRARKVCGADPEIGQAMAIVGAIGFAIAAFMIPFSHAKVEQKIENFLELKTAYEKAVRDPTATEADLTEIQEIVGKANAWLEYAQERKRSFLCNVYYPDRILVLEPIGAQTGSSAMDIRMERLKSLFGKGER